MKKSSLLIALASLALISCSADNAKDQSEDVVSEIKQKKPKKSFGKAKLDSINTDTLRASIGKVMEKLSQEDRLKAGAGLHLLLENASPTDVDIGELENADQEAGYIIDITADSTNPMMDTDQYVGNMIEYSEGRLDGKTASDLIEFRNASLDGSFTYATNQANILKSQISPAQNKLKAQIETMKQEAKTIADKRAALRAKGITFIADTDLKYKLFPKQRLRESEGAVTIKNPTSKTIQSASVWSELWVKGQPEKKNFSSITTALFSQNQTIPAGGTQSYNYVFQNRFRKMFPAGTDAPQNISDYGEQIVAAKVIYTDGSEDVFYLPHSEIKKLEAFPKKIKSCENRIQILDDTSLKIDAFLKDLSTKNINVLNNAPRVHIKDSC